MSEAAEKDPLLEKSEPVSPRPFRPAIPLREAQVCVDCDTIYQGSECPACTSIHGFAVARVIAPRDPEQTPWRKT